MSKKPISIQLLLDSLDEPALIVAGRLVAAANAAARDMLGSSIVGRDFRLAIRHPHVLQQIEKHERADLAVVGIGGPERPWTVSVRPFGKATDGCLVRFVDRSETITAERMRVDFVANASHELRTPLATISGYAETLSEPDLPDDLRQKFAATVGSEAARMLRIVEDLMSLSRIEGERFVAPSARVDLAMIARQAAAQIAPLAERRETTLEVQIEENRDFPVRGDQAQLLQAADNLLSNAVRYGGGPVTISVGYERDRAILRIQDRGPGILPIHLPRLTERFYRVDEARSRNSGGTGLGLAIVKHIVERHRGTLEIRSRAGEGTTVTLSFPPT